MDIKPIVEHLELIQDPEFQSIHKTKKQKVSVAKNSCKSNVKQDAKLFKELTKLSKESRIAAKASDIASAEAEYKKKVAELKSKSSERKIQAKNDKKAQLLELINNL